MRVSCTHMQFEHPAVVPAIAATLAVEHPAVVPAIAATLAVAHLAIRFAPSLHFVLHLVPGHAPTHPYQLVTAGLVEDSLPSVALAIAALVMGHKLLRATSWTTREFLRYLLIVDVLQAAATNCAMFVLYIIFREERFLFSHIGGIDWLITAVAVALKQQQLRGVLASPPLPQGAALAVAHAPLLALAWTTTSLLAGIADPAERLLFCVHGLAFSWAYLRFYQVCTFARTMAPPPPLTHTLASFVRAAGRGRRGGRRERGVWLCRPLPAAAPAAAAGGRQGVLRCVQQLLLRALPARRLAAAGAAAGSGERRRRRHRDRARAFAVGHHRRPRGDAARARPLARHSTQRHRPRDRWPSGAGNARARSWRRGSRPSWQQPPTLQTRCEPWSL